MRSPIEEEAARLRAWTAESHPDERSGEGEWEDSYPYWDRAFRTILPRIASRIGAERLPLPELVKP